eukprot:CAMPEP_0194687594 /NCGR_PEP_ID=MMETSP0295-20121207/16355_1 /TAXON_ID=39354 /ORGANISM="Heterosigma akashiwo, Strain CCMP2393" /LENGTH=32 /DNA_ID= /DNA_START= /DNA_END= /DNA_ORIENTATION=
MLSLLPLGEPNDARLPVSSSSSSSPSAAAKNP